MSPLEASPHVLASLAPAPATERVLNGFCHDLNGQLASAAGFLHLLEPVDGDGSDPAGGAMVREQLQASLDRLEDLVRQLRWLASSDGDGPEPVSTVDLVGALRNLLVRLPRFRNATIERIGPGELPATRVEIHATLRALLTAIDAGTPGGAVDRVGVVVEVADDAVRIGPESPGLHRTAAWLDVEVARAGLAWSGGADGTPVRIQLPRL